MFTKIGKKVAFLAALSGLLAIVASFFFPFDINTPNYRSSHNFRQAAVLMSQGFGVLFAGLVLGVLCEISTKIDSQRISDLSGKH